MLWNWNWLRIWLSFCYEFLLGYHFYYLFIHSFSCFYYHSIRSLDDNHFLAFHLNWSLNRDGIRFFKIAYLFLRLNKCLLINNMSFMHIHIMVDRSILNISCSDNIFFFNLNDVEFRFLQNDSLSWQLNNLFLSLNIWGWNLFNLNCLTL